MSDKKETNCQTRFRKLQKRALLQFVVRQTGVVSGKQGCRGQFQFVVVRQAWVGSGQTKAWFQGAGRVGVGGRRGTEPGRRRRRRGSRADEDCSGRGYWDTDRGKTDRRCRTETETVNS